MNVKKLRIVPNTLSKAQSFLNFPLGKKLNILLLLILLVSLVSCASRTGQRVAPFDPGAAGGGFRAGLSSIESFFRGGWQNYERTTAFIIFFFLFYSAFLIGAKKAFAGELTRAHKVFAFVAALLSASVIATTMRFDWVNLEYVAWFLIAVLTIFLIHTLLLKLGLENKKFLAFLLALLIAALLLWLLWYFMSEGRVLERAGRVSNWFSGLDGKPGDKVVPPGGVTPSTIDEPIIPTRPGKEGRSWLRYWWIAAIILLALLARKWWRGRGGKVVREEDTTTETTRQPITIPKEVGELLESVKNKKEDILRKIESLMGKIGGNVEEIVGIYKKYLEDIKKKGRIPWLRSERSPEFEAIKKDDKDVKKLIEEQKELEHLLIELSKLEKALLGKIEGLRGARVIDSVSYNRLLNDLKNKIIDVLKNVLVYYNVAVGELNIENQLDELFDEKKLEDRITDKWLNLVRIKTKDLAAYFRNEKIKLGLLENDIKQENLTIDNIVRSSKQKIEIVSPDDERIRQPFILGKPIELEASVEGFEGEIGALWNILDAAGTVIQPLAKGLKPGSPTIHIGLSEGNAVLELKININGKETQIRKNIILERNRAKIASDLLNQEQGGKGGVEVDDIHRALKELNVA
jgi:hypothetical protein